LPREAPRTPKGKIPTGSGELTGKEKEPSKLIYFKLYKSQLPIVEPAIETAPRMLGSDKSRGYCMEMICADFLASNIATSDTRARWLEMPDLRCYDELAGAPPQDIAAKSGRDSE